ncbi:translation initiation factor IF-2, putative [Plasmodium malariae]|uniref:Translation initiation factor IF-2, putative n=1 Tax=Plasmodium malariae TaxID=5858 RepID=A0A1D3TEA4_PLAMA|nr:translation initiation factor IF-2, putative [Plasmodium malariae]SCP03237.1 translation initiation factor IF-2, putative [Plasmodium malariae]
MIFLFNKLLYKGKYIPVGRRVFREKLVKGRKQKSPIILLPPYISIHELRLMLNINYETCFKAANVYKCGNKYRWKDSDDRIFQTVNKRNVIIPYNVAAYVSKLFKFKPKLIEVEIFCEEGKRVDKSLMDIYKNAYEAEKYYENSLMHQNGRLYCNRERGVNMGGGANTLTRDVRKISLSNQGSINRCGNDNGSGMGHSGSYNSICVSHTDDNSDNHTQGLHDCLLAHPSAYYSSSNERQNYYTVVSVIGHINHGKTTLLDKITKNNLALSEAGCITQNIKPINFEYGPYRFTFLDTPGHKVFQIFRGRAAFLSDILIILISLEVGAEIQTEESIKYADKFNIPVIFALNKADIYGGNESIVKAELKKQCVKMFDDGNLKHNFSVEIENSITISSLNGYNLDKLVNRIFFISQSINLPYHSVNDFYTHYMDDRLGVNNSYMDDCPRVDGSRDEEKAKVQRNDDLNLLKKYIRKSDFLLALDKSPFGMGIVVDISKDSSKGTILHVIVRNGFFIEGSYFICGSAYGRIQKMYKFNSNYKECCNYASIGMAVQISGIKKSGHATTDDLIFTLPQNNAFRLCQYRLMVEKLTTLQVSGKEIKVSWENDMKKNEFHAEDIYENRLEMSDKRKAIEEFGVQNDKIFEDVSVQEFHKSNTQLRKEENDFVQIELEEEHKYEEVQNNKKQKIQTILMQQDNNESILVPEEKTILYFQNPINNPQCNSLDNESLSVGEVNGTSEKQPCNREKPNSTKLDYSKNSHLEYCYQKNYNPQNDRHKNDGYKQSVHPGISSSSLINEYAFDSDTSNILDNNSVSQIDNKGQRTDYDYATLQNKVYGSMEKRSTMKEEQKNIGKEAVCRIGEEERKKVKNEEDNYSKGTNVLTDKELELNYRGRKNKYSKDFYTMYDTSLNEESSEKPDTSHNANNQNEGNNWRENMNKLNEPWYYEESEETWTKKVLQRNDKLMESWRGKTRQREIEKERQLFYEKQMILKNEIMKRRLLGEEELTEEEINAYLYGEKNEKADDNTNAVDQNEDIKLPEKNCPVIPIIIRTNYVGMFDIFLDEFENIQKKYNVKISVVHGGIGPITPNDVVHAEVESNYGYCCIYAFHVKILPDSVKQAVLSNIVIKQFDVFTDLIDDVVNRIKNVKALIAHNMYVRSLKNEKTREGL